ncbi:hypothetical protein ACFWAR_12210 [Streptomyces sp. NPDC059917]|uniref:hypothetical protein n=1 Tax=Streptomyces sp. NPDC059917 TaxID=3347002 RepID=UPI003661245E
MTSRTRTIVWVGVAVLGAVTAAGLGALVITGDLETADKLASVCGFVVGLAGLVVSLVALLRPPQPPPPAAVPPPRLVADGARSVAVGGNAGRIVTGDRVPPQQPPAAPPAPAPDPAAGTPATGSRARGERSVTVEGSVDEVITGDGPHP